MRMNIFTLIVGVLAMAFIGCTRAAKEDAKLNLTIASSVGGEGTLATTQVLAHVSINVSGSGINGAVISTWDNCQDCSNQPPIPTSFPVTVPSGSGRLIQILAVYKDSTTNQMSFYYGDLTKDISGSEVTAEINVAKVGSGNITSGRVAGRYFTTATGGPTGLIDIKYNPGGGKLPLIVDNAVIVNGWFSMFMLSGANLLYSVRGSNEILWGTEMSFESAAMDPAENSGAFFDQRVRALLPVHIEKREQNNTTTYQIQDAETYVWGYWGPGATGKKVCTSGLDSSPVPQRLRQYKTGDTSGSDPLSVSHYINWNLSVPTKAQLTDTTNPYSYVVFQGGDSMSSSCGSFTDTFANQFTNFQKITLNQIDGNGGDSVAGFTGIFRNNSNNNFVTVSSADPKVISGDLLPGVEEVFSGLRLFKRVSSEDYRLDVAMCNDLPALGFVPASSADAPITASGNVSLTSNITAAEGSGGVSAVLCPTKAGVMNPIGMFLSKWNFNTGSVGTVTGGPPTQIAMSKNGSPMNFSPTYSCFDVTVSMRDATGMIASPLPSSIGFNLSGNLSGTSFYTSYGDCQMSSNSVTTGTILANQNSTQMYVKVMSSGAGVLTPTAVTGSYTSMPLSLSIESSSSNYINLEMPQSFLAGTCYPGKVTYSYVSGGASNAPANIAVNLNGNSALTFYTDSSCTASTTSVTISSGAQDAPVFMKVTGSSSGTQMIASTSASGLVSADFAYYIGSGSSTASSFQISGPTTASAVSCTGPYNISLTNSNYTIVPATSGVSVNLTSASAFTAYSDQSCTSVTNPLFIPSGNYKGQVWLKFDAGGPANLNATASSFTQASYPISVGGLQKFNLLAEGTPVNNGACVRLEIQPITYPANVATSFPGNTTTLNFMNFPASTLFKNRVNGECVETLGTSVTVPPYNNYLPLYVYFRAINNTLANLDLAGMNLHLESSGYANGSPVALNINAPPSLVTNDGTSGNAAVEFAFNIIDIIKRFSGIPTFITEYLNGTWTSSAQVMLTDGNTTSTRVTDGSAAVVTYNVTGRLASWVADFTTGSMPANFSLSRSSQGYQTLASGYLSLETANTPRWNYDSDPASGHPLRGLMVEGPTTNILGSGNISEDVSLWDINPGGNGYAQVTRDNSISITDLQGATNPMWRLSDTNAGNGANVERALIQFTADIPDNQEFVASVFIKKDTSRYAGLMLQSNGGMSGGVVIDLDSGTTAPMTGPYTPQEVLASGAQKFNNGWYRVWVKFNSHVGTQGMFYLFPAFCSTAGGTLCQNGDISATGIVFVWGAQVEQGSSMTSYIPTSIGTRASDDLIIPTANIPSLSTSQGTFRAEYSQSGSSFGKTILYVGTPSSNLEIYGDTVDGKVSGRMVSSSVSQGVAASTLPFSMTETNKACFSYSTGSNVTFNIGTNGIGSPSANLPTVTAPNLTSVSLQVGGQYGTPASYLNGTIKSIHYWPYAFGTPGVNSCSK